MWTKIVSGWFPDVRLRCQLCWLCTFSNYICIRPQLIKTLVLTLSEIITLKKQSGMGTNEEMKQREDKEPEAKFKQMFKKKKTLLTCYRYQSLTWGELAWRHWSHMLSLVPVIPVQLLEVCCSQKLVRPGVHQVWIVQRRRFKFLRVVLLNVQLSTSWVWPLVN